MQHFKQTVDYLGYLTKATPSEPKYIKSDQKKTQTRGVYCRTKWKYGDKGSLKLKVGCHLALSSVRKVKVGSQLAQS